ncbi:uncharacterized protein DUF4440 [Aquimarina sp. MAR_2010_214]|uniref:nuclear transport factor 2 family protein n=1 Tax=Aquimarina sp. MAR_2010_214 TaxID=1250026 RepID=UPI000C6FD6F8|nr:nuclear transport factor 2 family protein [Aquimarina sp. MAR_2010_214]PKV52079.1 uncharacterized protein DUF4440 [Aquimarina sp. MAR_2010_214]
MLKFKVIPVALIAFLSFIQVAVAQEEDAIHEKINADMYGNFSKAFETLDYDLFASIHSKEMIRISGNGGKIEKANVYLKGYQKRWSVPSKKSAPIDFRLFERIYSDSLVSDRGIYRVTYINDNNQTKYSYGQFHVVLKMEDGDWKIWMDYDSNENKSINKDNYDTAFSISEYKTYWKR